MEVTKTDKKLFASVIIPLALPETYTWEIPKHLQALARVGVRVEVQLRNKKFAGIIKEIFPNAPQAFKPKEIINVLDEDPWCIKTITTLELDCSILYCSDGEVMQLQYQVI